MVGITVGHKNCTVSPGFSRADGSAPDIVGSPVLYGYNVHISGQADSMGSALPKKRELLPRSPGSFASLHWTPARRANLRVPVQEY